MEKQTLLSIALVFIYYHISGLATTNILRLTRGNTLSILSSKCVCDHCGTPITPLMQLPILSFLLCRGRCRHCRAKIPLFPLFLEMAVWGGMCLISLAFSRSFWGITLSFLYYEIVRVITLVSLGKREHDFGKNYAVAVLSLLPFYGAALFVALLSTRI